MPYNPNAPTERERSNVYFAVWIGTAASLAAVAATIFPLSDRLRGFPAEFVGMELLIIALSPRFDSYFRQLRDYGAVAALAVIALWLAANGVVRVMEFSPPALMTDGWFVATLAALAFHAGFLFAYVRGGR